VKSSCVPLEMLEGRDGDVRAGTVGVVGVDTACDLVPALVLVCDDFFLAVLSLVALSVVR